VCLPKAACLDAALCTLTDLAAADAVLPLQELQCSAWTTCEQRIIFWLCTHQQSIRADLYWNVLRAADTGFSRGANLGQRIILPSSFTGGPRYMQQLYRVGVLHTVVNLHILWTIGLQGCLAAVELSVLPQDAVAIVRRYGKPDLFITFTCNPCWPEIAAELLPGQTLTGPTLWLGCSC
jgi:Helitron helicase-like domain at N-terminus